MPAGLSTTATPCTVAGRRRATRSVLAVVETHELVGDDLAQGLVQPCGAGIAVPAPSGTAASICHDSPQRRRPPSAPRDLLFVEGLDEVALFQILEVGQADAALEALTDFTRVFLEPLERRDLALPDDRAVTEEANLRAAGDHPG